MDIIRRQIIVDLREPLSVLKRFDYFSDDTDNTIMSAILDCYGDPNIYDYISGQCNHELGEVEMWTLLYTTMTQYVKRATEEFMSILPTLEAWEILDDNSALLHFVDNTEIDPYVYGYIMPDWEDSIANSNRHLF